MLVAAHDHVGAYANGFTKIDARFNRIGRAFIAAARPCSTDCWTILGPTADPTAYTRSTIDSVGRNSRTWFSRGNP